jgi:hypothetical protein
MLIEQLSYTLYISRVVAKLLKVLMGVSTLVFSSPKVLKVLTPLTHLSNLAGTRMNTGFGLRCSMSILGEHLRQAVEALNVAFGMEPGKKMGPPKAETLRVMRTAGRR